MTPGQFAGTPTAVLSLPAATTTLIFAAVRAAIASTYNCAAPVVSTVGLHDPEPPKLMLNTLARFGFAGMPVVDASVRPTGPMHCGDDVGVEAAALAEHAHRQDLDVAVAHAGDADAVVGGRTDQAERLRAVPGAGRADVALAAA